MDLMNEFKSHGHDIYIICPNERHYHLETELIKVANIHLLRVKTLNYQKTGFIEKGLFMLTSNMLFRKAINKYWKNVKFDLLLYATPPISIGGLVKDIKTQHKCTTYLMLKDIDPQGIVDLGVFSKKSLFYKILRRQEEILYKVSDYIGCMSPANCKYVLRNNSFIKEENVEICPNSIKLKYDYQPLTEDECKKVRERYNVPVDKVVYIYGGNLGLPQGLDFLPQVIESNEKREGTFFLIVGSGTEYNKIKIWFDNQKPANAILIKSLPKKEYDKLVAACDVGLIFLHPKFTIPNYPSRLLSYLQNKMPIICATDKNTDIGFIAMENNYGFACLNGDIIAFNNCVGKMKNKKTRKEMGEKGYQFLLDNYTVEQSYNVIMSHFN